MQPNMAQVLNTLAHEIRTPLAVSQGYLKLYLDGRLTNADDQRRALQQTRDALGVLTTLCNDIGKVSALSERTSPALPARVGAAEFVSRVRDASELQHAAWPDAPLATSSGSIATYGAADLVRATALVVQAAFDEAREETCLVRAAVNGTLTLLAGPEGTIETLPASDAAPDAGAVNFARGGRGLKLIWAAFLLQQHGVRAWSHQANRSTVGLSFPLVQA